MRSSSVYAFNTILAPEEQKPQSAKVNYIGPQYLQGFRYPKSAGIQTH